jgi:hypothetical protein
MCAYVVCMICTYCVYISYSDFCEIIGRLKHKEYMLTSICYYEVCLYSVVYMHVRHSTRIKSPKICSTFSTVQVYMNMCLCSVYNMHMLVCVSISVCVCVCACACVEVLEDLMHKISCVCVGVGVHAWGTESKFLKGRGRDKNAEIQ